MRNVMRHPGHKFGEALRDAQAAKHSDRTMRGELKPKTGMETMPSPERGGSKGNRKGKSEHKIRGKVRSVEISKVRGGHKVRVHYHPKKAKDKHGISNYLEPEDHFHGDPSAAKAHVLAAMDNMEPDEPDSSELAQSI